MGKIPISYKAYDNKYAAPMGICLSIGGTCLIGGLMSNEVAVFVIGIVGIVLFFVFKILNSQCAKEEAEERSYERLNYLKKEVDIVLNDNSFNNEQKIDKLIKLSEDGNQYATFVLSELLKRMKGN